MRYGRLPEKAAFCQETTNSKVRYVGLRRPPAKVQEVGKRKAFDLPGKGEKEK